MTVINKVFDYEFISNLSHQQTIEYIMQGDVPKGAFPVVATINVDQLVRFNEIEELKGFIQKSYMILPDGQPIVWLSRVFGQRLNQRLSGSDLFPLFWEKALKENSRVFCITPSESVSKKLLEKNPNCTCWSPPFFDSSNIKKLEETVESLANYADLSEFDFVVVGIGLPNRERITKYILDNWSNDKAPPKFLLFGAAFEFYLGMKNRAPIYIQKCGLEWLYRFFQEPTRLFKRYFIDSWPFIGIILRDIKGNKK